MNLINLQIYNNFGNINSQNCKRDIVIIWRRGGSGRTDSNAYLLFGELTTLRSSRYVEIKMLPLSFREYVSALPDKTDLMLKYRDHIQNGFFPYILNFCSANEIANTLTSSGRKISAHTVEGYLVYSV